MTGEIGRYMVAAWKLHRAAQEQPTLTVAEFAKQEKLHDFVLERWVSYLLPQGRRATATWPTGARCLPAGRAEDLSPTKQA